MKASIAPERLLVWNPADGWEPLCEFLEVPVPDGPVPHVNDVAAFHEGVLGGGAREAERLVGSARAPSPRPARRAAGVTGGR